MGLREQVQSHNVAQLGDTRGQGLSPNSQAYVRSHSCLQTGSVSNRCLTFSGPVTDPDMLCHLSQGHGLVGEQSRFCDSRALQAASSDVYF